MATVPEDDLFEKNQVKKGASPNKNLLESTNYIIYHRNLQKLRVPYNILNREVKSEDQTVLQNVIPVSSRDKTLSLVRQRFYWTRIQWFVANWTKNCERDAFKVSRQQRKQSG